jgi:N-acetylglucosaminyldiphosphoundecaprenol N-acetyl-beta-D-mannosaminyltransferase
MKATASEELVDVLGIQIAPIDMEGAVQRIAKALREHTRGYVCMTGVHGIMEAHRKPALHEIFANSFLTAPDGMPTVWVGHWRGHKGTRQITGPDLMLQVLSRPEFAGRTHFLYGGKPGVAEELQKKLRTRVPKASILGTWTPPFSDLSVQEEEKFIATIARLKPDIIWVGISTPRQEHFMYRMSPRLATTLMFGVGAAFDFHTGRIQDCPQWVKRAGLQWFDRLLQDPHHLWKRYLRNNPAFLWHIFLQLSGLRKYPSTTTRKQTGLAATNSPILLKAESDL